MSRIWTLNDKNFEKFIDKELIKKRVFEIAEEINETHKNQNPLFIVVLNGAFMFASDLFKKITIDCEITFIKLSSYKGTGSCGNVRQILGLDKDIKGRTVVIIEDIVDTGLTLQSFLLNLKENAPKEIKIASCFMKPDAFKGQFTVDYLGYEIPDEFVVGYGLDYDGLGRNSEDLYKICRL